jgi:hypothetical protein
MKSMRQMREELLAQARWDGGYPKAIFMACGVVALARNAEEEAKFKRENEIGEKIIVIGSLIVAVGFLAALVWLCFFS